MKRNLPSITTLITRWKHTSLGPCRHLLIAGGITLLGLSASVDANVLVTFSQVGDDVHGVLSGSLNTSGAVSRTTLSPNLRAYSTRLQVITSNWGKLLPYGQDHVTTLAYHDPDSGPSETFGFFQDITYLPGAAPSIYSPTGTFVWNDTNLSDLVGEMDSTPMLAHTTGNGETVSYVAVIPPSSSYDTWAELYPDLTDPAPLNDFDHDGIDTGIEYVFGGNPSANDASSIAATYSFTASTIELTYRRSDTAHTDPSTSIVVEYGSFLNGWTPAVHDTDGIVITENDDFYDSGIDQVIVSVPRTLQADHQLFIRLAVEFENP